MFLILLHFQNIFPFHLNILQSNSSWCTIFNYQLHLQVENFINIYVMKNKNNNIPHHVKLGWIFKWSNSLELSLCGKVEVLHNLSLYIFFRWSWGNEVCREIAVKWVY